MAKYSERLMKLTGDIKALPYRDLLALSNELRAAASGGVMIDWAAIVIGAALAINPDEPAVPDAPRQFYK